MRKLLRSVYLPISLTVLGLGGLYAVSLYYYATFLSLASLFSIALALGIFMLVWTSRHYLNNNYLLFIGIAYLFIGSLQMAHTLALGAIGVGDGYSQNTPNYLWLASRYVESLTFLAAPIFINRAPRPRPIFFTYTIISLILLAIILSWNFTGAANI